jgi:hypothetical protein
METIFERVGALDVHKAQVTACARVPGSQPQMAEFSTTVQGLLALRDWLAAHQVRGCPVRRGTSRWRSGDQ